MTGRAWTTLEARRTVWRERLPQSEGEWLGWLAALPQDDLIDLLALSAASLALVPARSSSVAGGLERLVGLDMRQWWEPTPEAFLNHVPKVQVLAAMAEAGCRVEASATGQMKKAELVAFAAGQLAGRGWMPEPLRAAASPS